MVFSLVMPHYGTEKIHVFNCTNCKSSHEVEIKEDFDKETEDGHKVFTFFCPKGHTLMRLSMKLDVLF